MSLYFENKSVYVSNSDMQKMLNGPEGKKLIELAKNISVCLHEDWKNNLIREKGKEYQHFRPLKDASMEMEILAEKDKYLSMKSEDGKNLYRINKKLNENGVETETVEFDLIRVPFPNLTEKWQNANLDAAKFALCLVKTCIENGCFDGSKESIFEAFENMANDIHIEWMHREGSWASPTLLVPYNHLNVDTNGYNQKDKDRAHIIATTSELTFQPNIMARNRSIVVRAIQELFSQDSNENGLKVEFMEKIKSILGLIEKSNSENYEMYQRIERTIKSAVLKIIGNKPEISFDEFEKIASVYFKTWITEHEKIEKLPDEYECSYSEFMVDDKSLNFKNIARLETVKIINKMQKEGQIQEKVTKILDGILDGKSELSKKILDQNEKDFKSYMQFIEQSQLQ